MFNRIIAYGFFTFVGITSIVFYLVAVLVRLVTYPFDKRLRLLHLFTCFWASLYTWIMPPWRIRVEGRGKIRKNATYMVVSNHQSQLDILVAFRLFFHFKWVSKVEIFKVPLIGWNMTLNRYIRLKRGDRESIERMMKDCEERIDEGSSVFFFPEGTRSPDGTVKDFKPGAFQIAKKKKIPILPIVITGTHKALPKYSINFHGVQNILVKVFDEIPHRVFENLSIEETVGMVRSMIIENLNIMNKSIEGARP
ncbi:MAG: acyl-phosphate glycerol 3-phosphate acyltransferase [Spirochaetes bacterium RBG_13_51_14]|nr:MAG: acyl-phosphate glycerol 3-phosphate acyltransferase [Spirochaetes bacterium RBG_13_51_14]